MQIIDHVELLLFGMSAMIETTGRVVLHDEHHQARVVMPVRDFANYLQLAVTEIRQYGARSAQVCRRLTVLLQALHAAVEPARRPLVAAELAKLERSIAASFTDPDDLAFARQSDRQGIGGPGRTGPSGGLAT